MKIKVNPPEVRGSYLALAGLALLVLLTLPVGVTYGEAAVGRLWLSAALMGCVFVSMALFGRLWGLVFFAAVVLFLALLLVVSGWVRPLRNPQLNLSEVRQELAQTQSELSSAKEELSWTQAEVSRQRQLSEVSAKDLGIAAAVLGLYSLATLWLGRKLGQGCITPLLQAGIALVGAILVGVFYGHPGEEPFPHPFLAGAVIGFFAPVLGRVILPALGSAGLKIFLKMGCGGLALLIVALVFQALAVGAGLMAPVIQTALFYNWAVSGISGVPLGALLIQVSLGALAGATIGRTITGG